METQPRYRIITYTLRLEIPEEVDVDPDSLAERILNSLMDYDIDNKLLPAVLLPNHGPRLAGPHELVRERGADTRLAPLTSIDEIYVLPLSPARR